MCHLHVDILVCKSVASLQLHSDSAYRQVQRSYVHAANDGDQIALIVLLYLDNAPYGCSHTALENDKNWVLQRIGPVTITSWIFGKQAHEIIVGNVIVKACQDM